MSQIQKLVDSEVDRFCQALLQKNSFFLKAKSGHLTADHILRYLKNIHFLFRWTNINLKSAIESARVLGDESLAEFYSKKYSEECEHYKWAEDDIGAIQNGLRVSMPVDGVSQHLIDLMDYTSRYISQDPILYLTYMYLAESTTARVGGTLLDDIENFCGIQKKFISSIDKHVALDGHHADEGAEELLRIPDTAEYQERSIRVLENSISFLFGFFSEIASDFVTHVQPEPTPSIHA